MGFEDDSSQGQQEEEGRGGVGGIVNTTTPASESALEETSTNNTTTGEDAVKEIKKMAQRETKGARRWKIQVLLAMIVTGALMSVGTKYYLQKEEDDDYSESVSCFRCEWILGTNRVKLKKKRSPFGVVQTRQDMILKR